MGRTDSFSFSGSDGKGRLIIGHYVISNSKRLNEAYVLERHLLPSYLPRRR
jgi:hypothetical protein